MVGLWLAKALGQLLVVLNIGFNLAIGITRTDPGSNCMTLKSRAIAVGSGIRVESIGQWDERDLITLVCC